MTVDLRAIVATDLGLCISGDVGSNHISDRSGLQMFSGRLVFEGIVTPPRGTLISFLVASPQTSKVTRFPHPLRVIRSVADPLTRRSEIEVGCKLTLMKERKDDILYRNAQYTPDWYTPLSDVEKDTVAVPIYAQKLLEHCLSQIGITLSNSSEVLMFKFLRRDFDLSVGYVRVIGDLLRSECCFGRLRPDEKLEVRKIDLDEGNKGPILRAENLLSIDAITTGTEPPNRYKVIYNAVRR